MGAKLFHGCRKLLENLILGCQVIVTRSITWVKSRTVGKTFSALSGTMNFYYRTRIFLPEEFPKL